MAGRRRLVPAKGALTRGGSHRTLFRGEPYVPGSTCPVPLRSVFVPPLVVVRIPVFTLFIANAAVFSTLFTLASVDPRFGGLFLQHGQVTGIAAAQALGGLLSLVLVGDLEKWDIRRKAALTFLVAACAVLAAGIALAVALVAPRMKVAFTDAAGRAEASGRLLEALEEKKTLKRVRDEAGWGAVGANAERRLRELNEAIAPRLVAVTDDPAVAGCASQMAWALVLLIGAYSALNSGAMAVLFALLLQHPDAERRFNALPRRGDSRLGRGEPCQFPGAGPPFRAAVPDVRRRFHGAADDRLGAVPRPARSGGGAVGRAAGGNGLVVIGLGPGGGILGGDADPAVRHPHRSLPQLPDRGVVPAAGRADVGTGNRGPPLGPGRVGADQGVLWSPATGVAGSGRGGGHVRGSRLERGAYCPFHMTLHSGCKETSGILAGR